MIDGRAVVRGGRRSASTRPRSYVAAARRRARLWDEAKRRGHFPVEAEPAQP